MQNSRKLILKNTKLITKNIAEKYNLDYKTLLNENLPDKIPDDQLCSVKKPVQCYKAKIEGSDLCARHFERKKIDDENKVFLDNMIKLKRGRKKKDDDIGNNESETKVYVEVIDRQKFLLDDYNRVFYYNKTNIDDTCYIGVQKLDGSIEFDVNYLENYADKYPVYKTKNDTYNFMPVIPVVPPKKKLIKKLIQT